MFRITNRSVAATLCLALTLSAAACSQQPRTAENAPDQPQEQAPGQAMDQGTAPAAVTVTAVELGKDIDGDKRVTQKVEQFKPDDVVYAVVMTNGESTDQANLKVRWTDEQGTVIDESEKTITPNGAEATEFHMSKAEGLPVGRYKVEIFVNGEQVESREFQVVRA